MKKSALLLMVIFIIVRVQCDDLPINNNSKIIIKELEKLNTSGSIIQFSNVLYSPVILYNENQTKVIANITLRRENSNSLQVYNVETGTTCIYNSTSSVIGEYNAVFTNDWVVISIRYTKNNSEAHIPKLNDTWEVVFVDPVSCKTVVNPVKTFNRKIYIDRVALSSENWLDAIQFKVTARSIEYESVPGSHYTSYLTFKFDGSYVFDSYYFNDRVSRTQTMLFDENTNRYFYVYGINSNKTEICKPYEIWFSSGLCYTLSHVDAINYNQAAFATSRYTKDLTFCYGVINNTKIITCSKFDDDLLFNDKIINLDQNLEKVIVKNYNKNSSLIVWVESSLNQDYYIKAAIINNEGKLEEKQQILSTKKKVNKIVYKIISSTKHCFSVELAYQFNVEVITHCFNVPE